jgi:hypothetical protein
MEVEWFKHRHYLICGIFKMDVYAHTSFETSLCQLLLFAEVAPPSPGMDFFSNISLPALPFCTTDGASVEKGKPTATSQAAMAAAPRIERPLVQGALPAKQRREGRLRRRHNRRTRVAGRRLSTLSTAERTKRETRPNTVVDTIFVVPRAHLLGSSAG